MDSRLLNWCFYEPRRAGIHKDLFISSTQTQPPCCGNVNKHTADIAWDCKEIKTVAIAVFSILVWMKILHGTASETNKQMLRYIFSSIYLVTDEANDHNNMVIDVVTLDLFIPLQSVTWL